MTSSVSAEKFLHIPYDKRWEPLKPTIVSMYMEEREKIPRVAERMKQEYGFDANTRQYRHQFKKWNIKKRTTAIEKEAVITVLGKRRAEEIVSTSMVQIEQGGLVKEVDKKQLKRYINDTVRRSHEYNIHPGLLIRHDLPYAALVRSLGGNIQDHPSPFGPQPATPEYLNVEEPGPRSDGASPTTQLVQRKVLLDRAGLLLKGEDRTLMAGMSREDRRITATWFHDFWMFSFVTAKYWGRGPKHWTPSLINFKTTSPAARSMLEGASPATQACLLESSAFIKPPEPPSQLCKWSIHYESPEYNFASSSDSVSGGFEAEDKFDIEDEASWRPWSENEPGQNLATAITQSLHNRDFTTITDDKLPLASDVIIGSITKTPNEGILEAIAFAIMTRNQNVLANLLKVNHHHLQQHAKGFAQIFPFHLAATFLDGHNACCNIMWTLMDRLDAEASIAANYVNEAGLTVLDTMFVSILRSHTKLSPEFLPSDVQGTKQKRFRGSDVDVCGRWDADSPCIRHLHESGEVNIPSEWKHMFCHTSVQAVCHCITAVFMTPWRPNVDTPSGLFRRRCSCGLELVLGPLHALVVVAFHLGQSGLPGENLFGMIACLVCLLTVRADPHLLTDVCVEAIVTGEALEHCSHRRLNAAELSRCVPEHVVRHWTQDTQLGWRTLVAILNHAVDGEPLSDPFDIDDNETADEPICNHKVHKVEREFGCLFVKCGDEKLGIIWAAIQVELLTYRRLEENDSWISPHFDLRDILQGLQESSNDALQRYIQRNETQEIQEASICGLFDTAYHFPGACASREEACKSYYANLDDWKRTKFISRPSAYD